MARRILFVVNHAGFFLSHRLTLATAALSAGFDVFVATPNSRHVAEIAAAGLRWTPIRMSRSGTHPWREAKSVLSLYRVYRHVRPDLVHHVTSKPVLYGTVVARVARIPAVVNAIAGMGLVFRYGDAKPTPLQRLVAIGYGLALRHPNMRVLFQNQAQMDEFQRRGWVGVTQCKLVHGAGVDPDVFFPASSPAAGTPHVVLVARMLWEKGIAQFVDAARTLRNEGVVARFILIGEPDPANPRSIAASQLESWQAEGVVEYWGRRDDVAEILRVSTVACLPTYYPEGVPKALIEAAASGLPIVTTDIPGCRDIVLEGESGLVVPIRDVTALTAALRRLLRDPELRAQMGKRARDHFLARYTLEHVVRAHLAIYRELLA